MADVIANVPMAMLAADRQGVTCDAITSVQ